MNLTAEDKAKVKAVISEAVDRLFADEQKPEHYDGEPCNLPIAPLLGIDARGVKFEYTGEYRVPKDSSEWFRNTANHIQFGFPSRIKSDTTCYRWILRAVPVEPQWKPGDYAYSIKNKAIVQIQKAAWGATHIGFAPIHECKDANGTIWKSSQIRVREAERKLRPLQDADWTREIAGVKVRAYEGTNGGGVLRTSGYVSPIVFAHDELPVMRELCAAKNIPIMPLALSRGKFKAPE
jgi:hypothetical protein